VHSGLRFGLTRREAWTFVALVIALVGFGVAPRPLVDSQFAASSDILRVRQLHRLDAPAAQIPP
jgi:NADH:ubiquinone oxidoreductase subunit 4 (subunit M)